VLSSSLTFAWGPDGHEAVGKIASLRIKQHTRDRIAQILKPGETLARISSWADFVKYKIGEHDSDPDTDAFLQDVHNKDTRDRHFDDLPPGCTSYDTCTGFTPDNDVVHLINICTKTLQGHLDPNQPLSPRNALRLLVHFMGDIHQPLGTSTRMGQITRSCSSPTPRPSLKTTSQRIRAQNLLIIDNDKKNLHAFGMAIWLSY
jgi:hypothetical protein